MIAAFLLYFFIYWVIAGASVTAVHMIWVEQENQKTPEIKELLLEFSVGFIVIPFAIFLIIKQILRDIKGEKYD